MDKDVEGMKKHLEQLAKKAEKLDAEGTEIQNKCWKVRTQMHELEKQIREATRNTIEYHKGDMLLKYKNNFDYHDDICTVYELLGEVKPSNTSTTVRALHIALHSYDSEICTNIDYSRCDVSSYEDDDDVYYIKSSALQDLLMLFHDLSIEGVPDGNGEEIDNYLFGKIKTVIDAYGGKKLVDVIRDTEKYRKVDTDGKETEGTI